ncbi:MAG: hypothetical protein QOI50_4734 [Pseudonocardiales bacterium]|nr:hypothetical protein [Pseudonocardiales bacterium]MDT7632804.1 hypothetical protein [Pseudonocardiales bacterium]MDT7667146.1 hypothetical protein [Pseudonocardiales bacterium]
MPCSGELAHIVSTANTVAPRPNRSSRAVRSTAAVTSSTVSALNAQ